MEDGNSRPAPIMLLLKLSSSVKEVRHFKSLSKKFDIYSKIVLMVHKNENFLGSDYEFCTISLLVMLKY